MLLVTFGSLRELGFSNSPHRDIKNSYCANDVNVMNEDLKYWNTFPSIPNEAPNQHSLFLKYRSQFSSTLGWSSPTTCCYQHVVTDQDCKLFQFFVMQGLSSCVRIDNFTSHHFYADSLSHNTSVCIGIVKGKVYVKNHGNRFGTIFGWGACATDDDSTGTRNVVTDVEVIEEHIRALYD